MPEITKATFKEAGTDTKLDILFDYIISIHDKQDSQLKSCGERFVKLESKKLKDTGLAAMFGLIGGFLAVASKKILGL